MNFEVAEIAHVDQNTKNEFLLKVELRVPLNPEFFHQGADFLGIFWADTGGSVKMAEVWSEVIRKPPQSMAEHSGL